MNLIVLALLIANPPTPADNWPGFRGDGTGKTQAANLPLQWSPDRGIAWKTKLTGYGQSSPVIWKNRIFVTSIEGPDMEVSLITAVDLENGKQLWQEKIKSSQTGKNNNYMSRAAPTPVVDGNGVYVFWGSGDLRKYSHEGKVMWQRSLTKEYGNFDAKFGIGSSLAQTDKAVIVLVECDGPSYLLAVDKATGKNLWKTPRQEKASWTSPVATRFQDKELVLVNSQGTITCYDADSGKEVFTIDGMVGNSIPSVCLAGSMFVAGASSGPGPSDPKAIAQSNCLVLLIDKKDTIGYRVVWQPSKVESSMSTPLIYRGQVYYVNKVGLLTCLNLKTGEEYYSHRLEGACWASAIASGNHIYFFGKSGATSVIKAGPKFEQVAQNQLWKATGKNPGAGGNPFANMDPLVYGVAAVDGTLVFRTGTELYCVRKEAK